MHAVNPGGQAYGVRMCSEWLVRDLTMMCLDDRPADSQTSAPTQPGHYVRAEGSLMPGKSLNAKSLTSAEASRGPASSEADKSAEGKGITSSSVFAQKPFAVKKGGRSRIPQDLFTRPRRSSFGAVEAEIGKMEQSLHKS